MSWEGWLTLAVVTGMVAVLSRDRLPPALVVFSATVLLLISGVITSEEALSGFSNPAPITVAALFVVARAVSRVGVLEQLVARLLAGASGTRGQLARLLAPAAASSAFLNNTPIVAMMAPVVSDWAARKGLPASRFLIPLSFATILGGTVTLIGTSTNIVVSELLVQSGAPPLGMFELTPLGLPVAAIGCALMVALAPKLLPDRRPARGDLDSGAREFSIAMRVVADGPLDGQSLEGGGLRHLEAVYCVQLERAEQIVAPVRPDESLRGGDVLTFVGRVDHVLDLQRHRGLAAREQRQVAKLGAGGQAFFEVVVAPSSRLVGQTLRNSGFRASFGAAVLAIHRAGHHIDAKLGGVELRAGDTLLVLAEAGFRDRWRESGEFLVVAPLDQPPPPTDSRAVPVAAILVAMVSVAAVGVVPILHAALVAALAVIAIGAVPIREVRRAVDVDVLIVIASAFGLSAAIGTSGVAGLLGGALAGSVGTLGPLAALLGVLLTTMVLTELVTNNAAAALVLPIALGVAADLGAAPRPFAIAVALGASLSFLTPIGYQTNLMVYGMGGYRFGDFSRLGLPLALLAIVGAMVLIPAFWTF